MTNEEYLKLLEQQFRRVIRKYSSIGRITPGRTITSVQLSIENCMDDMDEIQKEMQEIDSSLRKENDIVTTNELTTQLQSLYLDTLKSISAYRITGKFPE